jgi:hypothetical protein
MSHGGSFSDPEAFAFSPEALLRFERLQLYSIK